jgi:ArsR family metal-binding transcriptional regulator
MSLCFRCGRHSCMSSTKLKTLRPMRPNVALHSLWKAFMHEFHEVENYDRCSPMSLCLRCGRQTCMHARMISTKLKTLRPMRPNVALPSLWKAFMHEFHEVENATTDAAQMSLCLRCGRHSCMDSTKLKTLRPMRPNVALLSLWKAFIHEFHEVENATTDAAQGRCAFVVEGIHYDRCGSMSRCFRCGRHSCRSSTKLKTLRPMRSSVALLSFWKAFVHGSTKLKTLRPMRPNCRFAFVVEGIHA